MRPTRYRLTLVSSAGDIGPGLDGGAALASDVTVGIDIGTTSVKALAVDGDGTVLARARVEHAVLAPGPNALEHDADHAWRRNVVAAYDEVRGGHEVAAVNMAAMVP